MRVRAAILAEDTGQSIRTIGHWTDIGILRAEPGTSKKGRGFHREYEAAAPYFGERTWALIAAHLSDMRIPLVEVRDIISSLRIFGGLGGRGDSALEAASPIRRALLGSKVEIWLVWKGEGYNWSGVLSFDSIPVEQQIDNLLGKSNKPKKLPTVPRIQANLPYDFVHGQVSWGYLLEFGKVLAPLVTMKA